MRGAFRTSVLGIALISCTGASAQQAGEPGSEEFGLSPRQLVKAVETVEGLIARCMREQGFRYIAADFTTVRRGMSADQKLPGLTEEEFINQYGYGITTTYTGKPIQLADGYSPGKVGLGEQNVDIFKNLSPADQVAYNRALLGENADATFAVGLETENFSRTGGCTREAVAQVFDEEQLKATYYNPKDAAVNKHHLMLNALAVYRSLMRDAGFDYEHPDEVEPDLRERLAALTAGGTIPVEAMTPEQLAALEKLKEYERRVARKNYELATQVFDPVEERIHEEMFPRGVK